MILVASYVARNLNLTLRLSLKTKVLANELLYYVYS